VVKRTGDGSIIEFRSVVDAVRCAIEVQNGMIKRNAGPPPERRIEFRVGIHFGDVVEESDGDFPLLLIASAPDAHAWPVATLWAFAGELNRSQETVAVYRLDVPDLTRSTTPLLQLSTIVSWRPALRG
jgi:hypothetical protein